jgi:hypothetical protein
MKLTTARLLELAELGLSDTAFRVYLSALARMAETGAEGLALPALENLPGLPRNRKALGKAISELIERGLAGDDPGGVVHFVGNHGARSDLSAKRAEAGRKGGFASGERRRLLSDGVPEEVKRRARADLTLAVKSGALVRLPCTVCGAEDSHGHHHDYSKPLDVTWLCPAHHAQEHEALMKQIASSKTKQVLEANASPGTKQATDPSSPLVLSSPDSLSSPLSASSLFQPDFCSESSGTRPESKPARGAKSGARQRFVPDDWKVKARHRELASELRADLAGEEMKFREHEFKDPKQDFDRAFSRWLRRSVEFKATGVRASPGGGSTVPMLMARVQRLEAEGEGS